ncbi:MAG: hypothetical protein Q8Q20_02295 [bacterium]|nr:hypothetical protein [bacterium]
MGRVFFIIGRFPSLSRAEIWTKFSQNPSWISSDTIALDIDSELGVKNLHQMGGTIKVGQLIDTVNQDELRQAVMEPKFFEHFGRSGGRYIIGISAYGQKELLPPPRQLAGMGLNIKKELRKKGRAVRLVTSRINPLSSVIVSKNKLIERGAEIVLIYESKNRIHIGFTLAVQNFEAYGHRDYGRPKRDMRSQGMIPPKLAQIMLNVANVTKDSVVMDPFCGGGTILQEALLLGCRQVIGSDSNPQAIEDTKNNLRWLRAYHELASARIELSTHDARKPFPQLAPDSIDAVVTEPYLGPLRPPKDEAQLGNLRDELTQLYSQSLKNLRTYLKPAARVVLILPSWHSGREIIQPDIQKIASLSGFSLSNFPDWVGHNPFLYHREGQNVARLVAVLIRA